MEISYNQKSLNSFTPQRNIVQGNLRKRLYSWTRPSKQMPRKKQEYSETIIAGEATLAFSRDGTWFQGNIISPDNDAYTVTARKREPVKGKDDPSPQTLVCYLRPSDPQTLGCSYSSDSFISSTGSRELSPALEQSPSEASSLDFDLVAQALASFQLEEECEGTDYYDLAIMDYETGINHRVRDVGARISGADCQLTGDSLKFESHTCSKGVLADKVIQGSLGPTLIEKDLVVYQGGFSYTYSDSVCYPASLTTGHWCM